MLEINLAILAAILKACPDYGGYTIIVDILDCNHELANKRFILYDIENGYLRLEHYSSGSKDNVYMGDILELRVNTTLEGLSVNIEAILR